jgi:molybdopterin converting factor small subunit
LIEVRLFATLPMRSRTGRKQFELDPRPGLTVRDVAHAEGVDEAEIHLVMINGTHGNLDSPLHDGDRLGLFPPIGGG